MPLQVFCQANYYTTGYTFFVPWGYVADPNNLRTSNMEYVYAGR